MIQRPRLSKPEPEPERMTFSAEAKLLLRLLILFPAASVPDDFTVSQDADGRHWISAWLLPDPMPSRSQLEAVLLPEPNLGMTARQARLWLLAAGLDDEAVRARISAIPDKTQRAAAVIEWEYSVLIHLNHPLVQMIGLGLGLTPEQLRAAFAAGAAL